MPGIVTTFYINNTVCYKPDIDSNTFLTRAGTLKKYMIDEINAYQVAWETDDTGLLYPRIGIKYHLVSKTADFWAEESEVISESEAKRLVKELVYQLQ